MLSLLFFISIANPELVFYSFVFFDEPLHLDDSARDQVG